MTIEEYYLANRPRTLGEMIARGFPRRQTQMNEAVRMTQESQRQRLAEEQAASDITQGRAMAILNAQAKAAEDQARYEMGLRLQAGGIEGQRNVENAVLQAQRMAPIIENSAKAQGLFRSGAQDEMEYYRRAAEAERRTGEMHDVNKLGAEAEAQWRRNMGEAALQRAPGPTPRPEFQNAGDGRVMRFNPDGSVVGYAFGENGEPVVVPFQGVKGAGAELNKLQGAPKTFGEAMTGKQQTLGGLITGSEGTLAAKATGIPGLGGGARQTYNSGWDGSKDYSENKPFVAQPVEASRYTPMSLEQWADVPRMPVSGEELRPARGLPQMGLRQRAQKYSMYSNPYLNQLY
jgi:hypothetical protein